MTDKTVAEQIAEAVAASEVGLKAKNKNLLKETKETKELLKKFDSVDLEALQKASKELTTLKANQQKKDGDYEKLYNSQQAQHKEDNAKTATELSDTKSLLSAERINNGLTLALVDNHINPELIESSLTILNASDDIVVNDEGVPMMGDKTMSDVVKDWVTEGIGKNFVTDANVGGGANGGGGTGSADAAFFDPNSATYNMTEQGKIQTADPARYESLKAGAPAKKAA